MSKFTTRHESGSDWQVIETSTGIVKASGLSSEEAEDTANAWNRKSEREAKDFIENSC